MYVCECCAASTAPMALKGNHHLGMRDVQVDDLKEALAGNRRGMLATLVREAAEPMQAQATEVEELRAEVDRQRRRADEARICELPLSCTPIYENFRLRSLKCAQDITATSMAK